MSDKMVKVIVKRVGSAPTVEKISDSLESLQELVHGYIESIYLDGAVGVILNEEGKLLQLPENTKLLTAEGLPVDYLVGDLLVFEIGRNNELTDISESNEKKYLAQLNAGGLIMVR